MDSRFDLYLRLTGQEPKTQHQKILAVLLDGQWHLASELHGAITFWKGSTRISELKKRGVDVAGRQAQDREQYEYKLLTKWEDIDLKSCSLKATEPVVSFLTKPQDSKTSKLSAPILIQAEIIL